MRLLTRYLIREYLKLFTLCGTALFSLFLIVELFERVGSFLEHETSWRDGFAYFLFKMPVFLPFIVPLASLMGILLLLGLLTRQGEITGMKACGLSVRRAVSPLLILSVLWSLGLLALGASVLPLAHRQAHYLRKVVIEGQRLQTVFPRNRLWFLQGPRTLYRVEAVDPDHKRMYGVTVYRLTPDFRLGEMLEAKEAVYTSGAWVLSAGKRTRFLPDGTMAISQLADEPLELTGSPEEFQEVALDPALLTTAELRSHVERMTRYGQPVVRAQGALHARGAFAMAPALLTLLGAAVALWQPQRGLTWSIGLSLLIGLLYWVVYAVSLALGHAGILPPALAAWAATVLFGGFGAVLFARYPG